MAREILLRLPKEEKEFNSSPFSFVLFSSLLEVGRRTTAIITSKIGSMPTSFQEEIETGSSISENISAFQDTVGRLSGKVLERYPEGHKAHDEAERFLTEINASLLILNQK